MTSADQQRCPDCGTVLADGVAFCASCGRATNAVAIDLHHDAPASAPQPRRPARWGLALAGVVAVGAIIALVLGGDDEEAEQPPPTTVPIIESEGVTTEAPSIIGETDQELLLRAGDGLHAINLQTGQQRTIARGYNTDVDRIDLSAFRQGVMSVEGRFVWGLDLGNNVGLATILEAGEVVGSRDVGNAWMLQAQPTSTRAVLTILNAWNSIAELQIPNSVTIVGAVGSELVLQTPSGTVLSGSEGSTQLSVDRAFSVADPYIAFSQCSAELVCMISVRSDTGEELWRHDIDQAIARRLDADHALLSPDGRSLLVEGSNGHHVLSADRPPRLLESDLANPVWTTDNRFVVARSNSGDLLFFDQEGDDTFALPLTDVVSAGDLPLADGRIHAFVSSTGLFGNP